MVDLQVAQLVVMGGDGSEKKRQESQREGEVAQARVETRHDHSDPKKERREGGRRQAAAGGPLASGRDVGGVAGKAGPAQGGLAPRAENRAPCLAAGPAGSRSRAGGIGRNHGRGRGYHPKGRSAGRARSRRQNAPCPASVAVRACATPASRTRAARKARLRSRQGMRKRRSRVMALI